MEKIMKKGMPETFLFWLLIIQPLLDVASYWTTALELTVITTTLRMVLFAVCMIYGFLLSDRKKVYVLLAAASLFYAAGHLAASIHGGCTDYVQDLSNVTRVIYMPAMTVCFITIFRTGGKTAERLQQAFAVNVFSILALLVLSIVIGPRNFSYEQHHIGYIGWVAVENCQSAILVTLPILGLYGAYRQKKPVLFALVALCGFGQMFLLGTRLALYSIFIIIFMLFLAFAIDRVHVEKKRVYLLILAIFMLLTAVAIPISPNSDFRRAHSVAAAQRQDHADVLFEVCGVCDSVEHMTAAQRCAYHELYTDALGALIERFGLEKVMEVYDCTIDVETLYNSREKKLVYCRFLWEESDLLTHLFGVNLDQMIRGTEVFDPENDFNGLLYSAGYVGFGMYLLFLAFFVWRILRALIRDFRGTVCAENIAVGISICLLLGAAQFSGNVLRRPNVAVYLSLILAYCWQATKKHNSESNLLRKL